MFLVLCLWFDAYRDYYLPWENDDDDDDDDVVNDLDVDLRLRHYSSVPAAAIKTDSSFSESFSAVGRVIMIDYSFLEPVACVYSGTLFSLGLFWVL